MALSLICNLRIYELTRSYPELRQKGLMMLTFFSSPQERIIKYIAKSPRPFPMIADPDRFLCSRFGIRSSVGGFLFGMMIKMPRLVKALILGLFPHLHRDMTQMPADFQVGGPDLTIKGIYYGRDVADHIPM
jgi:hypothetical protein